MTSVSILLIIAAVSLGVAIAVRALIASKFEAAGISISPPRENRGINKDRLFRSMNQLGQISPVKAGDARALRGRLIQAGIHMDISSWRGIQIASAGIGVLLAVSMLLQAIDTSHVLFALLVIGLGLGGPSLILRSLTRDRQKKIASAMPATLELLSITVKSGYPLERGLKLIASTTQGPLSDEFRQVDTDINLLGMSMERSLKRMADRCNVPTVTSFTAALIQASRQGSSVSRVLDSQARLARNEHYARLQEQVNKLPAKLVAPIFGIMMLIIVIALVPPIYDTVLVFSSAYSAGV